MAPVVILGEEKRNLLKPKRGSVGSGKALCEIGLRVKRQQLRLLTLSRDWPDIVNPRQIRAVAS